MRDLRTEQVKVSLTPGELARWQAEANGEALAPWVRRAINDMLSSPSPTAYVPAEDDTNPEIETREERADRLLTQDWSEKWDDLPEAPDLVGKCPDEALHWQLPRGQACPVCGLTER